MIWTLGLMLAVGTAIWLFRPVFGSGDADSVVDRRKVNAQAYEDGLAEIQRQQEAQGLSDQEAEQLRAELGQRLLREAGSAVAAQQQGSGARSGLTGLAWAACALIPLAAAGIYYALGSKTVADQIAMGEESPELAIESMVSGLAQRLQQAPDDPEGWAMLGRSYFTLERHALAAEAYRQANERAEQAQADWLVGEAEAWAFANQRSLQGYARDLLDRALAEQPNHERGLWYSGLSRIQAGETAAGIAFWKRLLERPNLPAELRAELQAQIQQLSGEVAPRPESDPADSGAVGEGDAGLALKLRIELAAELAPLPEQGVLFVFARQPGVPPMPLAVQRFEQPQFPLNVRLTDADSMMPQLKLSTAPRWEVIARFSRGGTVQAQSGDLEGRIELSRDAAGAAHDLRIDQRLP